MDWKASSTTPQLPVAFGTGTLELVQLATPNRSYTTNANPPVPHTYQKPKGLDTYYPYRSSSPTAYVEGGPAYTTFDDPRIPLDNVNAGSVSMAESFTVALHIARGVIFNAQSDWAGEGQHKEMMAEFGKALQLAPDSDLANYYYGFGWHNLEPKERAKMGSIHQAKASLQKAILLGKADVKEAAQKVLKDLNKPSNKPANKPA